MEELRNSSCAEVFRYFHEMNQIPRCSGDEKAVSDWLVRFARERGLSVDQDAAWNVVIRKPGTPGYENAEPVILQGHMDMVCVKTDESDHDFSKDPIRMLVNGDRITADGTTLGGDNGIAVSYGLALLDASDIPHPPLELLVTTSEETGMDGAFALDPALLTGRRLINIDAEEEGKLLVSCAGGVGATLHLPIQWEAAPAANRSFTLTIDGLLGGHSGMEIHKQRASANVVLGRILRDLAQTMELHVAAINGGSKHNAIPNKAQASLCLNDADRALVSDKITAWSQVLVNEYRGADDGIRVSLSEAETSFDQCFSAETLAQAINILRLVPTGVLNVSLAIPGLVQTSNNLGVVITAADEITFESAIRSSVRSNKEAVADQMALIAGVCGATITCSSNYPEWQYNPESGLRDAFVTTWKEMTGEEPEITAIHAGLECGLFSEKYNGAIDLIAFGPNLYDVHSPMESMSISSVEATYEYLKKVLANLK